MRKQNHFLTSLLAIILLFASLAPAALAGSGDLGGSFAVDDNAPSMGNLSTSSDSWDPTNRYTVTVPVQDQDKMKDVSRVEITLKRDGYTGAAGPTSMVVMSWTRNGNSHTGKSEIAGAGSGGYRWNLNSVTVPESMSQEKWEVGR